MLIIIAVITYYTIRKLKSRFGGVKCYLEISSGFGDILKVAIIMSMETIKLQE